MIKDPPQRYAKINDYISRGAYPSISSFEWLRQRGYRHLVYIGTGMPGRVEILKIKESNLTFNHVPLAQINVPGGDVFDPNDIKRIFKVLNEIGEGRRIYMFDDDGVSAVGFISALMRLNQGWSQMAAVEEMTWLAAGDIDGLTISSIRRQIVDYIKG